MNDSEFIDFRDQLLAYTESDDFKFISITLLSGDRYVITRADDVLICPRVVYVFQGPGTESCFLFDTICNVDVIRSRES